MREYKGTIPLIGGLKPIAGHEDMALLSADNVFLNRLETQNSESAWLGGSLDGYLERVEKALSAGWYINEGFTLNAPPLAQEDGTVNTNGISLNMAQHPFNTFLTDPENALKIKMRQWAYQGPYAECALEINSVMGFSFKDTGDDSVSINLNRHGLTMSHAATDPSQLLDGEYYDYEKMAFTSSYDKYAFNIYKGDVERIKDDYISKLDDSGFKISTRASLAESHRYKDWSSKYSQDGAATWMMPTGVYVMDELSFGKWSDSLDKELASLTANGLSISNGNASALLNGQGTEITLGDGLSITDGVLTISGSSSGDANNSSSILLEAPLGIDMTLGRGDVDINEFRDLFFDEANIDNFSIGTNYAISSIDSNNINIASAIITKDGNAYSTYCTTNSDGSYVYWAKNGVTNYSIGFSLAGDKSSRDSLTAEFVIAKNAIDGSVDVASLDLDGVSHIKPATSSKAETVWALSANELVISEGDSTKLLSGNGSTVTLGTGLELANGVLSSTASGGSSESSSLYLGSSDIAFDNTNYASSEYYGASVVVTNPNSSSNAITISRTNTDASQEHADRQKIYLGSDSILLETESYDNSNGDGYDFTSRLSMNGNTIYLTSQDVRIRDLDGNHLFWPVKNSTYGYDVFFYLPKGQNMAKVGSPSTRRASDDVLSDSVTIRTSTGTVKGATPTEDTDLTTKKYVDDLIASLEARIKALEGS